MKKAIAGAIVAAALGGAVLAKKLTEPPPMIRPSAGVTLSPDGPPVPTGR